MAGSSPAFMRIRVRHCPAAIATGMPPSIPLSVVSGVLKSPCASTNTMPTRRGFADGPECCSPLSIPKSPLQFANSPIGRLPFRRSSPTLRAPASSRPRHCWPTLSLPTPIALQRTSLSKVSSLSSSFSRLLIFRGQQFFQRSKPSAAESRWQHRQEVLRSRPGIEVAIQHRLHFTVRRLPTEAGKEPTNYNESETLRV